MFREWGFLLSEIWGLLALAALIGLLAGWLIWGRRITTIEAADNTQAVRLKSALDNTQIELNAARKRIGELEALTDGNAGANAELVELRSVLDNTGVELAAARKRIADLEAGSDAAADAKVEAVRLRTALDNCEVERAASAKRIAELENTAPIAAPLATPVATPAALFSAPSRPVGLEAARGDKPDDLKLIKGVGPVLEKLCHKLGYYHFDQIAAWTPAEIAWVDDNLEGFKGRVTRDEWVKQARDLAAGLPPLPGGEH